MKKAVLVAFLAVLLAACAQQSPESSYEPADARPDAMPTPEEEANHEKAMASDDLVQFEAYLDTLLNQGHGVGHDVYNPILERLARLDQVGIAGDAMDRVRQKVEQLKPEHEGPAAKQLSAFAPAKM